jgi:hypothetical protein
MKNKLQLSFIAVALTTALVGEAAVCNFSSTNFPGSYGCSNESCGYGCTSGYGYVSHWACVAGSLNGGQGCCICNWETWSCNCSFGGTGTGSVSIQVTSATATCPPRAPVGQPQNMACISAASGTS